MDTWARKRKLLAREKAWIENYVSHLPELKPCELVRGTKYHCVTYHSDGCAIYTRRARCSCRPTVKFYREPVRN
jgi:hypothetical protein